MLCVSTPYGTKSCLCFTVNDSANKAHIQISPVFPGERVAEQPSFILTGLEYKPRSTDQCHVSLCKDLKIKYGWEGTNQCQVTEGDNDGSDTSSKVTKMPSHLSLHSFPPPLPPGSARRLFFLNQQVFKPVFFHPRYNSQWQSTVSMIEKSFGKVQYPDASV